jgi:hypothetical protein
MKVSVNYHRLSSLPSNRTVNVVVLTSAVIVASVILYLFDPSQPGIYPSSPFRLLTGLYCPGCGTLRGLHQLLHGNLIKAFDYNPLMVLTLPYLIYSFISYTSPVILNVKIPQMSIKAEWIWWLLKIVLAYWVLRNIPFAPFSWLAP